MKCLTSLPEEPYLSTVKNFPEASVALQEWYHELLKIDFRNFNELKRIYFNASMVGDERVAFDIMGNKYRLVVSIVFDYRVIQIKWFGTHAQYDKIGVAHIKYKNK